LLPTNKTQEFWQSVFFGIDTVIPDTPDSRQLTTTVGTPEGLQDSLSISTDISA